VFKVKYEEIFCSIGLKGISCFFPKFQDSTIPNAVKAKPRWAMFEGIQPFFYQYHQAKERKKANKKSNK